MKKKWTIIGLCMVAALLFGAVVVEVAEEVQKSVVSNWSDCALAYETFRRELPPLPLPMSAEELLSMAEKGDWSFQANPYWTIYQPETLGSSHNLMGIFHNRSQAH